MSVVRKLVRYLFVLTICLYGQTAQADPIPGVPETDSDLANIVAAANHVIEQSLPVCLSAVCVGGNCGSAAAVDKALSDSAAAISQLEAPLLQLRDFYTDFAEARIGEAGIAQAKVNELKRLQLLQDSLQVLATAAAEAASWQDFLVNYKGKILKSDKTNAYIARFVASHLERLKSVLKISNIGSTPSEKPAKDILTKFLVEMSIELEKVATIDTEIGLNTPKGRASIGKLLRKIGDLVVNMDRVERQLRTNLLAANADVYFGDAEKTLVEARRINDRIGAANQALRVIQRARLGVISCSNHLCEKPIVFSNISDNTAGELVNTWVDTPLERQEKLRALNQTLQENDQVLRAAIEGYKLTPDLQSNVRVSKARFNNRALIKGALEIAPICVPDEARLQVLEKQADSELGGRLVMDLGPLAELGGGFSFRVFDQLQSRWRTPGGREIRISVDEQDIKLEMPDTPQAGRDREYEGSLETVSSRSGRYVLALRSADGDKTYVSTGFEITGSDRDSQQIEVNSSPRAIEDISSKLPDKVRRQLFLRILSDRLSYKINLEPQRSGAGGHSLSAAFWTYRLLWDRETLELDQSSVKEKLSQELVLRPIMSGELVLRPAN